MRGHLSTILDLAETGAGSLSVLLPLPPGHSTYFNRKFNVNPSPMIATPLHLLRLTGVLNEKFHSSLAFTLILSHKGEIPTYRDFSSEWEQTRMRGLRIGVPKNDLEIFLAKPVTGG